MLWIILYLACLGAALLAGLWIFFRLMGWPVLDRWLAATYPAGFVAFAFIVLQAVEDGPFRKWNAIRLAPAVSLLHGYTLYYGRDDGPVTGNIYTPFSSIAYVPAALGPGPTEMIRAGVLLSLLFYFAPAVWLYAKLRDAYADPATRRAQWYTFALFPLVTFNLVESLGYVAGFIHADAPAVGLAGAAGAVLYAYPRPGWRPLAVSALLATLSVWSKQVTAPVLIALPAWLFLSGGGRDALRYLLCLLGAGLLVAAVFLTALDPQSLLFNVVTIPGQHPMRGRFPFNLVGAALELQKLAFPLLLLLGFGALFPLVARSEAARLAGWAGRSRWSVFLVAGLFLLPTALMGRVKEGGDLNALAFTLYFLLLAVCLILRGGIWPSTTESVRAGFRLLTVVAVTANGVLLIQNQLQRYSEWASAPRANVPEMVTAFLRDHPGEAYFPWNPLEHLLAEWRYYHFDYGLFDRDIAGFALADEHFRQCVPPDMRLVCFPENANFEYARKYLKEFSRRVERRDLPGFICYEREYGP